MRRIRCVATPAWESQQRRGWIPRAARRSCRTSLARRDASVGARSGGAARAVIVALRSREAAVTVHARRSEQASEVAASLGADVGPGRRWRDRGICWSTARRSGARRAAASPLPSGPFDGRAVYDLTYGRECQRWSAMPGVRAASRSMGCRCWWRRRNDSSSGGPDSMRRRE